MRDSFRASATAGKSGRLPGPAHLRGGPHILFRRHADVWVVEDAYVRSDGVKGDGHGEVYGGEMR